MDKVNKAQILREIQEYVKQDSEYYFTLQDIINDIERKSVFEVEVEMIDRQIKQFPKTDYVALSNDFLCCKRDNITVFVNTKLIRDYKIKEVSNHDTNNC